MPLSNKKVIELFVSNAIASGDIVRSSSIVYDTIGKLLTTSIDIVGTNGYKYPIHIELGRWNGCNLSIYSLDVSHIRANTRKIGIFTDIIMSTAVVLGVNYTIGDSNHNRNIQRV